MEKKNDPSENLNCRQLSPTTLCQSFPWHMSTNPYCYCTFYFLLWFGSPFFLFFDMYCTFDLLYGFLIWGSIMGSFVFGGGFVWMLFELQELALDYYVWMEW